MNCERFLSDTLYREKSDGAQVLIFLRVLKDKYYRGVLEVASGFWGLGFMFRIFAEYDREALLIQH
jgi:hypothetical protein